MSTTFCINRLLENRALGTDGTHRHNQICLALPNNNWTALLDCTIGLYLEQPTWRTYKLHQDLVSITLLILENLEIKVARRYSLRIYSHDAKLDAHVFLGLR